MAEPRTLTLHNGPLTFTGLTQGEGPVVLLLHGFAELVLLIGNVALDNLEYLSQQRFVVRRQFQRLVVINRAILGNGGDFPRARPAGHGFAVEQRTELCFVYRFAAEIIESELEQPFGLVVQYVGGQRRHRGAVVGFYFAHHLQQRGAVDIGHLYVENDQIESLLPI